MWLCHTHIDLAQYDVHHATYDDEEVEHVPRVSEVALQQHDRERKKKTCFNT